MANQTVTSNTTLDQVITAGLTSGDTLTINNGAIVTVNQSPDIVFGRITINDGELFIDGENAANPIVLSGEQNERVDVNGAGIFRTSLGWWEFPTVSNGLANQVFDCSSYFSSSGSAITSDAIAGVWVETGRRINYSGGVGVAPQVGDWMFDANDNSTHGRILEVVGDVSSGYIVVSFLTGSLSASDTIELHTLQNKNGPDYQKSWTASVVSPDVLEPDVFQEFGNCFQNGVDNIGNTGPGISGLVYSAAYQSNLLTFGNGTSGLIPPVGARIRIPMIHFASATVVTYAAGQSINPSTTGARYNLELQNGGDCFISGLSVGTAHFEDSLGGEFQASYCAAQCNFGAYATLSRTTYDHCIFVSDSFHDLRSICRSVPPVVDLTFGSEVRDCLGVFFSDTGETSQFGGQTSNDILIERCIQISNSGTTEFEFLRVSRATVRDFVLVGSQFVLNATSDVEIELLKTMGSVDGSVSLTSSQVLFNGNSSRVKLTGWEILDNSATNSAKLQIADSSDIECRCFHFHDDPFDNEALGGTEGEEFYTIGGFCSNITIARCYQDRGNPNEFGFQVSGTVKNVTVLNCGGEYGGEVEPDGINTSYRGLRGGSGNVGQSSGIETDYPGTAGAQFGDIFRSDSEGAIYYRNVPGTVEYPITVLSGNPKFTKDGDVDVVSGDQWECDMGYVALGHTGFTGVITTARATSNASPGTDQWTAVDIDFQYNLGQGYNGTWLDLRTPSNLTAIPNTAAGVRLKLRFTANSSMTNGQAVAIYTNTSLADQYNNLHPIDQNEATLNLTGLKNDSEVRIYRVSDSVEVAGQENVSSGTFSYDYVHSGSDIEVFIVIHSLGFLNQRLSGIFLTDGGLTIPIQQTVDRQYQNT